MELTEKWMRRLVVGTIIVSVVLQLAAIFMPGWMVRVRDTDHEEYTGLFYAQRCFRLTGTVEELCETRSRLEWYLDDREIIQERGYIALATEDITYHRLVKKQVFVVVTLIVSVLIAVAEGCTLRNYLVRHPRRTAMAAISAAFCSAFIIEGLSDSFIEVAYWRTIMNPDNSGYYNSYVGVPYSLALYGAAGIMSVLGTVFLMLHCSQLNMSPMAPRLSFPAVLDDHQPDGWEKPTVVDHKELETQEVVDTRNDPKKRTTFESRRELKSTTALDNPVFLCEKL